MALFPKKKKEEAAEPDDDERDTVADADDGGMEDDSSVELKKSALQPKGGAKAGPGLLMGLIVPAILVTAVAAAGGLLLGQKTAATIETAIALKDATKAQSEDGHPIVSAKYASDMVLKSIDAVVTNLAEPADTWIRLETAIVFKTGALENPDVTAAEIRQDILAYLRTVTVARLDGPSALQHLRDDLNERVAIRTGGRVSELVLQTLVIQ